MGLSSLPAPSEGVLCVILVNTALSISIVKGLVQSILQIVGVHLASSLCSSRSSPANLDENVSESLDLRLAPSHQESLHLHTIPSLGYMEDSRSLAPAIRFDTIYSCRRSENDCSVCLSEFQPESNINYLSCGHIFHKSCLEKWMDYSKVTCPLCRTPFLPEEEVPCF